ncbi:codanin-1 [Onthophagus taurus]|uniref:codanin-1 n=1 Tax=Onthophagus taurus TaxID=166361 RepID=UPI0039BDFE36
MLKMSLNVLLGYINREISEDELITWLNSAENSVRFIKNVSCNPHDFLAYFINFLHDSPLISAENLLLTTPDNKIKKNFNTSFTTSTPINKTPNLNATWPRKSNEFKSKRSLNFYQKDHTLCLGDFVSNIKTVNKQNKRRIKPTFLNKSEVNSNEKENVNIKNLEEPNLFKGIDCENVEESRTKIIGDLNELQKNHLKLDNLNFNIIKKEELIPKLKNSTFTSQIDLIVKLYVYLIKNNSALNVLSELYFLISLLTSKSQLYDESNSKSVDENSIKSLFKSIHNQIYFSLESLSQLKDYLKIFDKTTLNLILNNPRISDFYQDKYFNLEIFIKSLINEKNKETLSTPQKSEVRNVNFTTETDNKDNFINLTSFHAFRKQRDSFYDLLNVWEDKLKKSKNTEYIFQQKIKNLLGLCTDPVNLRQLAKLFKSQLLLMCNKEIEVDLVQNEEEIFKHFPGVDSSKLNKLRMRLSSRNHSDFESKPDFYGYEEFFKGFILNCANPSFLEHLKDVILNHILIENDYVFTGYDLIHRENVLKTQAIDSLYKKLSELLILAKFLGYVESLPYQESSKSIPNKVLLNQIKTRTFFRPILDLNDLIIGAINKKRIAFTIPWIVIYLSMFDYVSLRLPSYQKPIKTLFEINQGVQPQNYGSLLVIVSLNWLFGLPHFPKNEKLSRKEKIFDEDDKSEDYFKKILNGNPQNGFPIDELNLISENCLYLCVPALEVFKNVLSTNNNPKNCYVSKHITPLTKKEPEKSIEEIQKQLEEAFLNSQPETVRKLIEFATEKVTSSCIQHLTSKIIEIRKDIVKSHLIKPDKSINDLLNEIKSKCFEISEKIIQEKIDLSIKGLSSIDELPVVVEKCVTISKKICREKIKTWIEVSLSSKDVEKAINQEERRIKTPNNKISSNLTRTLDNHHEDSLSGVEMLNEIKELMLNLIENQQNDFKKIIHVLDEAQVTIEHRCDVNDNVVFTIYKLIVELSMVLVVFNPHLAELTLKTLKKFWSDSKPPNETFKQIVSIRNIHMLSKSGDKKHSWDVFIKLLTMIVENRLILKEDFEAQCLSVFKQNWDDVTLKEICAGYQQLIKNLHAKNIFLSELLTFLSTFCYDLNNF